MKENQRITKDKIYHLFNVLLVFMFVAEKALQFYFVCLLFFFPFHFCFSWMQKKY